MRPGEGESRRLREESGRPWWIVRSRVAVTAGPSGRRVRRSGSPPRAIPATPAAVGPWTRDDERAGIRPAGRGRPLRARGEPPAPARSGGGVALGWALLGHQCEHLERVLELERRQL